MSKHIACVFLFTIYGAVLSAFAIDPLAADVSSTGIVTNDVASGQKTETRLMTLTSDQQLVKTGAGELVINDSVQNQSGPLNILVKEGKVTLAKGSGSLPTVTLPDSIKNKMMLWLSVSDSPNMVASGSPVEVWRDVRETSADVTNYCYAVAEHFQGAAAPVRKLGECVRYSGLQTNKMDAVYFGGYTSGIAMKIVNAKGESYMALPIEMFAVHGVNESWGNLFGMCHDTTEIPAVTYVTAANKADSLSYGYGWREVWSQVSGDAALWINGERADRTLPVRKGFQIADFRRNTTAYASTYGLGLFSFYSSTKNETSIANAVTRKGGDYLSELIYFKSPITQSERAIVTAYLQNKWFPGQGAPKSITMTANGTASFDVTTDGAVMNARVRGAGAATVTGTHDLVLRSKVRSVGDEVPLALSSGKLLDLDSTPVKLVAGYDVSAGLSPKANGPYNTNAVVMTASARSDKLVKSGDGTLTVEQIPSSVKTLEVQSGQLMLRSPITNAWAGQRYEIPLANAGFEIWPSNIPDTQSVFSVRDHTDFVGWKTSNANSVRIANFTRWSQGYTADIKTAMSAYFGTLTTVPEGDCCLFLKEGNRYCYQVVTIPEDGDYEVSAFITGRAGISYCNCFTAVELVSNDDSMTTVADFGYFTESSPDWVQQAVRAMVRAGTYRLRFTLLLRGSFNDPTILLDDIHLARVGAYRAEWKLPGGDFEADTNATLMSTWRRVGAGTYDMTADWKRPGWTFDHTLIDSYPANGIVCYAMRGEAGRGAGCAFNGSADPLGGIYQVLVRRPSSFSTTFTPPAGTWYLKATVANWWDTNLGQLSAKVSIGGNETSLGVLSLPNNHLMTPSVWPTPFTVDGEHEITVTFTYALSKNSTSTTKQGCSIDDIKLVAEYENVNNLLQSPDLESRTGWNLLSVAPSGEICYRTYGASPEAFGTDFASGDKYCEIYRNGILSQTVVLPHTGWYRLSFLAKGRIYGSADNAPVAISLDRGGVTNEIGRLIKYAKGNYQECNFDFYAESGEVTLMLQGTSGSYYCCVDDFALKYLSSARYNEDLFSPDLRIRLASDALMSLDFDGVREISSLKVNGTNCTGVVDHSVCPQLYGTGSFKVTPAGVMLLIR